MWLWIWSSISSAMMELMAPRGAARPLKHVGTLIFVQAAKDTLEMPDNSFRPIDQIELFS